MENLKKPHNCDGRADAEACGHLHRMDLQCESIHKTLKMLQNRWGSLSLPWQRGTVQSHRAAAASSGYTSEQDPRWETIPYPKLANQAQKGDQKGKTDCLGLASSFPRPGVRAEQGCCLSWVGAVLPKPCSLLRADLALLA